MSNAIQLYYNPMSRARIVQWALEETGAPYETTLVSFEKEEERKPGFLALNPMGKVPMIVHRGTVITETAAILTYLGDAFPEKRLAPALGDLRRGTYLRWLFFVAGCYEAAVVEKMYPRINPPSPKMLGFGTYADVMDTVEKIVQPGPFLLGEEFTMADLYLSAELGWNLQFQMIEPRPAFVSYVKRCEARPAALRANELADGFIQQMKAGGS